MTVKESLKKFLEKSSGGSLEMKDSILGILNEYGKNENYFKEDKFTIKDALEEFASGTGIYGNLSIQLYGTWSGHLDEIVCVDEAISETIDTGINIQDAPSDLIYFIFTIECDGEYGEDVDITTQNIWSGVNVGLFGRMKDTGKAGAGTMYTYTDIVRPQNLSELSSSTFGVPTASFVPGYITQNFTFRRTVVSSSYGFQRIMGGNYTVNVYGLKFGNL